jgi:hypothetical protein
MLPELLNMFPLRSQMEITPEFVDKFQFWLKPRNNNWLSMWRSTLGFTDTINFTEYLLKWNMFDSNGLYQSKTYVF